MKSLKSILAITFAVVFSCANIYAQQVEEVTLTVSGDGATKKEATEIALRSAIEQAFGVFVSANTTILNDELVKDEIATVSSGNIKKYEEIATATLPNGNTAVTLKTVVSVSKLITYAQSKGSTAEFAGATFGINMKLKELNKQNEEKAIENMLAQLEALAPSMFDYQLFLGEPTVYKDVYNVPATISVLYNNNTEIANGILLGTLKSLSLSKEEQKGYKSLGIEFYTLFLGNDRLQQDVMRHSTYNMAVYDTKGEPQSVNSLTTPFILRSKNSIEKLKSYVNLTVAKSIFSFKITDNIGGISSISMDDYYSRSDIRKGYSGMITRAEVEPFPDTSYGDVYKPGWRDWRLSSVSICHLYKEYLPKNGLCYQIKIKLSIPKDEISKYSNFTISNKE